MSYEFHFENSGDILILNKYKLNNSGCKYRRFLTIFLAYFCVYFLRTSKTVRLEFKLLTNEISMLSRVLQR